MTWMRYPILVLAAPVLLIGAILYAVIWLGCVGAEAIAAAIDNRKPEWPPPLRLGRGA